MRIIASLACTLFIGFAIGHFFGWKQKSDSLNDEHRPKIIKAIHPHPFKTGEFFTFYDTLTSQSGVLYCRDSTKGIFNVLGSKP